MTPLLGQQARVPREAPKTAPRTAPKTKRAPAKKRKIFVLRRGAFFYLFAGLATLLTGLVILNLSQRAIIAQDALRAQKLRNSVQAEKTRQERLFLNKTKLGSLRRIEKIAVDKLGMVTPPKVEYLVLPPDISKEGAQSDKPVYLSAQLNSIDKNFTLPR